MKQPAQVMPIVSVTSVEETRDFYVDKLGFDHQMAVVGNDGNLDFCTVLKEGGRIMFNRLNTPAPSEPTVQFYFQVSRIQELFEYVKANGLNPGDPEDMWWGDRVFIVEDNNGHKIWFYESVGEPIPPEGMKII